MDSVEYGKENIFTSIETMLKISCYYEVRFNETQIFYEKID